MQLRTYQAYTMAQALAAVKEHLGQDAVILHTRTFKRGGFLGVGQRTLVEVTATPGRAAAPQRDADPAPPAPPPVAAAAARRSYAAAVAQAASRPAVDRRLAAGPSPVESVAVKAPPSPAAPAPMPRSVAPPRPAAPPPTVPAKSKVPDADAPARPRKGPARRFVLQPAVAGAAPVISSGPPEAPRSVSAPVSEGMQDELNAIRTMVGQVLQRQGRPGSAPAPSMPQALFDMYLKLIGQELSEELADTIVNEVRDEISGERLDDEQAVREAVLRRLAACIPVADRPVPAASPDGRPLTIVLVGPTGVGKTTTLAKLAASFKLRHGRRVGLVTADTYRIAAVDQLRTYANIIGLPLQVALTPADMRRSTHALADSDVILVDTAGRSQNDGGRIAELKAFVAAADPHEVHLVLSGTAGEKVLLQEAEAFGAVGVDKIVLTKIDEAVSFGVLVNVVRRVGKQLSFLTTGQEVPDHIERGRSERLADLVLGGSVHT